MPSFKQISAFVLTATKGSLSAAAKAEQVTPAVISRRLDALEARLGVRLILRTTRRLQLTHEGQAFLDDCQRILNELSNAEESVAQGGARARGHLKISAPAGFGRRHVAPLVAEFMETNPEISIHLDLTDRLVDLVNEGVDCAVRIGELSDSSLISLRLAENRRLVVASPEYLAQHGLPQTPEDLVLHDCLLLEPQRGWTFSAASASRSRKQAAATVILKVSGRLQCNDGAVLREWALAGRGLAWRSEWEVGDDLRAGRLVSVLDDYAAPPVGIHAIFPQRRHLPLRVRLFVDFLRESCGQTGIWGDFAP
ncbi:MAG: LysR family transcriptional regulator [Betaproteobacteria bacterium]|nr:LysR family transcriptional regulator [Betaproteobacteria bacterium]